MTTLRIWSLPSKHTSVLFLGVAAVSVIALVWMGVRLMQQDRALEARRFEERRETAADRAVTFLDRSLAAEERKLAAPSTADFSPSDQAVFLTVDDSGTLHVNPENALLYYPEVPSENAVSSRPFVEAERAEFRDRDFGRAIRALRPLTLASDPATRAGAVLRMARNLRKAGQLEAALETYTELTRSLDPSVSLSGVPIDLVARRARCMLLEELGDREDLQKEAQSLLDDLSRKRWRLDRAAYLYYRDQATGWLSREPESDNRQQAVSEAVIWLWQNREALGADRQESSGRRSLSFHAVSVAVLWRASNRRLTAIVAGPEYQQSRWFGPVFEGADFDSVRVGLSGSDGALIYGNVIPSDIPKTTRLSSATGLPWDIVLVNSGLEADLSQFAQRRRLMMAGLGMLVLLVIAASYLIGRAVSRELAAARLQSDFVSAVSHEFRTPLTSMRQFTEMLVENEKLPEEKRAAYYRAQERATSRLSRLVESLLDFGRMEAGARPYRLERLDVGRLVEAVVREFRQEFDLDGGAVDCEAPDEGPLVHADGDALAQALWNLLDNAVKYADEEPSVRVEVESGPQVVIRVRDQGIGIPSAEQGRIFRKFVRGSSAKACGVKGTGIGLAMVKHIVDAHGGKVLVASEPNQGSAFSIVLPAGD